MGNIGIYVLGLSHKTAPVGIREKFAFKKEEIESSLLSLNSLKSVEECMILSTCNRVEIYFVSREENPFHEVMKFLVDKKDASMEDISKFFYKFENRDAVRHSFKVASSLDSMIVGEPQIVGQFKDAFNSSKELGTSGAVINRLCETALKVSKRVRTETGISKNAVSISFAAVELAKKIFGNLHGKSVAIIGAGEMAELAVKHLVSNGVSKVFVVNRTLSKAQELASEFGGEAFPLNEVGSVLKRADIVISSTGAKGYVLTHDNSVDSLLSKRNPTFLIDIAVPRDIDPELSKIDNVYLYDIDDLNNVVQANIEERKKAAVEAEAMIEGYVERFMKWIKELELAPLIAQLKQRAEEIRREELDKRLTKLNLTDFQREEIENTVRIIINKILHTPITAVKEKAHQEDRSYLQTFKEIFGLGKD
jgi:glutamyl-tRNA reductase